MRANIRCIGCGKAIRVEVEPGAPLACPECGVAIRVRKKDPGPPTTVEGQGTGPIGDPGAGGGRIDPALFAGRYRFLRLLGEGGMGRVELHLDTWMNREVALKVPLAAAVASPRSRERFLREVRTLVKVRNPNICHVLDVDVAHDPIFFTMEYLEGEPLDAALERRGPLPPAEAAGLVRTVALALADAHDKQVVHRDLKPSNILMVGDRPVLIDFGLALHLDARTAAHAEALKGTLRYMSPEQVQGGNAEIGPASDLFALGIILYELLTGVLPFDGDNVAAVLARTLMVDPDPPSTLRPGLDPRFDDVCARALAKEPGRRYASMRDLAAALAPLVDTPDVAPPGPDEAGPGPSRRPAIRARGLVALGAVVLVAVGLLLLDRGIFRRFAPGPGRPFAESIGLLMLEMPAGAFQMGMSREKLDEHMEKHLQARGPGSPDFRSAAPRHRVELTRPFAISAHETTLAQFRAFVLDTGYRTEAERDPDGGWGIDFPNRAVVRAARYNWKDPGFHQTDRHPACTVSWNDAVAFCEWLTRKSAGEGVVYRLPTEAEWEYACRAGEEDERLYSFGDDRSELSNYSNSSQQRLDKIGKEQPFQSADWPKQDGFLFTAPVGSFRPNAWGLHDMHGNVAEWCLDNFDARYYEQPSARIDPQGPDGDPASPRKVLRGGMFLQPPWIVITAIRLGAPPSESRAMNGFRVVRVRAE